MSVCAGIIFPKLASDGELVEKIESMFEEEGITGGPQLVSGCLDTCLRRYDKSDRVAGSRGG